MQNQAEYFFVVSTCPNDEVAKKLANQIVDEGLAACVNIVPGVISVYKWQGQKEQDSEVILFLKTTQDKVEALKDFVFREHPYELPELIAVPIKDGLSGYLDWISASLK